MNFNRDQTCTHKSRSCVCVLLLNPRLLSELHGLLQTPDLSQPILAPLMFCTTDRVPRLTPVSFLKSRHLPLSQTGSALDQQETKTGDGSSSRGLAKSPPGSPWISLQESGSLPVGARKGPRSDSCRRESSVSAPSANSLGNPGETPPRHPRVFPCRSQGHWRSQGHCLKSHGGLIHNQLLVLLMLEV